jgi:hypothetical protein
MWAGDSQTMLSAGMWDGKFLFGISEQFPYHGWKVNAGQFPFQFNFPTDPVTGFGLSFIGLGLSRETDNDKMQVGVGATQNQFTLPFFTAGIPANPSFLFTDKHRLSTFWTLDSHIVLSARQTIIESLSYSPLKDVTLSASGGIGSNQRYLAARFKYVGKYALVNVEEISAGPHFQRLMPVSPLLLIPEPVGFNFDVTLIPIPRFLRFDVQQQNDLAILPTGATKVKVDTESVYGQWWDFDAHFSNFSSVSSSSVGSNHAEGQAVGVGFKYSIVTAREDVFFSRSGTVRTTSIFENITRKIQFSQFVTQNNGTTSFSIGGGYHGNMISIDVSQQEVFLPLVKPTFQNVTAVNFTIHVPHSSTLTGGTLVTPTGAVKFTLGGGTFFYGDRFGTAGQHSPSIGKYVVAGIVVNAQGDEPVEGIEIYIGRDAVFSDGDGKFELRTGKAKTYALRVDLAQSTTPGRWAVVDAPTSITAAADPQPVRVTVRRQ